MDYNIYIIFSATPYRIGSMIRRVTKEQYNHVSLSLDESLTKMYAFARRHYYTPLHGGFVQESPSRYIHNGQSADICLCRLPISQAQFEALKAELAQMYENKELYLYNHLSALTAIAHKRIAVKDAYTCVEFCVKILHELGFEISPNQFYSVGDLQNLLKSYIIFTGPIPQVCEKDAAFFAKQPILSPIVYTLRDMLRLIPRYFENKKAGQI